jgi:hypothetical protein
MRHFLVSELFTVMTFERRADKLSKESFYVKIQQRPIFSNLLMRLNELFGA